MEQSTELEDKDICRVCLTQDGDAKFLNIFNTPNLQIELLSIGNIEVFQSDGMPSRMCEICRNILAKFYKFKQICKRSDTLLKMYPMTGKIPAKLELPPELLPVEPVEPPKPPPPAETSDVETQTDELPQENFQFIDQNIEMVPVVTDQEPEQEFQILEINEQSPSEKNASMKIEIKEVKILNKATSNPEKPPKVFKKPTKVNVSSVEIKPAPKILNSVYTISKEEIETSDQTIQYLTVDDVIENTNENQLIEETELIVSTEQAAESVHICEVCDKTFPLLQQLEIHKINHERSRDHPCSDCDKSFFTKYDLGKHMLTHTKQRDYTCIVCNKSFSRSTLLYRHEKIHTDPDIPRYNCMHCNRVYLNSDDLEKHSSTHKKKRPFQCQFCDKSFVFKQGLERHETIHDTKSMQFSCQYCHLKLPTAAQLQRHLSSEHLGEKKFPCRFCPKRFTLSHHLHRHLRKSHKNEEFRSYQCSICEDILNNRSSYFTHCEHHAESSLNCPLCKQDLSSTNWKSHVAGHEKEDVYLCDHCSLVFINSDELENHLTSFHADESELIDEEVEFLIDDEKSDDIIEYEYIGPEEETFVEPPPKKAKKSTRSAVKSEPEPSSNEEVQKRIVKMSREKIARLKKEGKIQIINGEMIMVTP